MRAIKLGPGEVPQGDRWLLIEWKPGEGSSTNYNERKTAQLVPEHLWSFWQLERPLLAERQGLDEVYFKGKEAVLQERPIG